MKRLIALLFLTVNCYAVSGPFQSKRYFEHLGGKFDHISPLLVPDRNAGDLVNVTMDERGQPFRRNGYTVIESTSALGISTWTVTGLGYHNATVGANFGSVIVGTDIYKIANTFSSYSNVTGTVTLTLDNYNLAQATSLNDATVYCNEDDTPFYLSSTGNALAISTSTFEKAKTCTTYGNYLIVGNTTESTIKYPSRIRWSDVNTLQSFPVLNFVDIEPDDGDFIVSVIQYEDSVYIFKRHSIYRMLITGSDGPDAFIIRPVVRNNGAWAKNSVKVIPGVGVAFLSQNTVYTLNGSYASQYSEQGLKPIGDPIQRTIDTIDRTQWTHAVAEVYPRRYQYWLSVSTAAGQNNLVLVYDYVLGAWTTYTGINASAMMVADDNNGKSILITGDNHATTYKQDQIGLDNPIGVSTAPFFSYISPDYTLDLPELTKGYKYLYLFSQADSTTTINVQAAYDLSTNYEFNQDVQLSQATPLYDVDLYDQATYPGTSYKISRLELNRSARTIRLKFTSSTNSTTLGIVGWTIVFAIEDYKE